MTSRSQPPVLSLTDIGGSTVDVWEQVEEETSD